MDSELTVFVVEDDEAALKSVLALLKARRIKAQGFASAEAFLEQYQHDWQGCAVIDIRLPGKSGLELLAALKHDGSSLPVILVTAYGDIPVAVHAMKSGALDFIEKPYAEETLMAAVETGFQIASDKSLMSERRSDARKKIGSLTERERDVLELLARGMTNKEIAMHLGRSPRTIEVHRNRIREKTEANTLSDIIRVFAAS